MLGLLCDKPYGKISSGGIEPASIREAGPRSRLRGISRLLAPFFRFPPPARARGLAKVGLQMLPSHRFVMHGDKTWQGFGLTPLLLLCKSPAPRETPCRRPPPTRAG